jgi:hypothetical protein
MYNVGLYIYFWVNTTSSIFETRDLRNASEVNVVLHDTIHIKIDRTYNNLIHLPLTQLPCFNNQQAGLATSSYHRILRTYRQCLSVQNPHVIVLQLFAALVTVTLSVNVIPVDGNLIQKALAPNIESEGLVL